MKPRFLWALGLGWALGSSSFAFSGLELSVSKAHSGTALSNKGIYTLSYFTTGLSHWPGFSEWGIVAMPGWSSVKSDTLNSRKVASFVGVYGGHLFLLGSGFIRPGFELGSLWKQIQVNKAESESPTTTNFGLYYSFKVQILCLTFLVSNQGYGLGLNFSL
jgi:hypothetical protein